MTNFAVCSLNCEQPDGVLFYGEHSECVYFMEGLFNKKQKPTTDFDLFTAIKCEHGLYEIGTLSSYVLFLSKHLKNKHKE
jgi:hypothetical protein